MAKKGKPAKDQAKDQGKDPGKAHGKEVAKKAGKPPTTMGWKIFGGVAAALASMITRKLVTTGWTKATGRRPPANPASASTTWADALGWAVASGAAMGVARAVAARQAAATWKAASGRLPPGLDEVT